MKLLSSRTALLIAFLAAGTFAPGHAQSSLTYTNTVTVYDTATFSNLSLTKFDTTLGTLTGVEVRVNFAQTGGTFSVTNTSGDVLALFATMDATIGGSTNLGFTALSTNFFLLDSAPALPLDVPAGTSQLFSVTAATIWTNQVQNIDPSFWSAYSSLGGGSIDFQVYNNSEVFIDASGIAAPDSSDIQLQTSMTVTYSFVPEPSTFALLAVASLGLAGYAIRRRR